MCYQRILCTQAFHNLHESTMTHDTCKGVEKQASKRYDRKGVVGIAHPCGNVFSNVPRVGSLNTAFL